MTTRGPGLNHRDPWSDGGKHPKASGIRLEALFEAPLSLAEADRDARRGASYGGEDWVVYSLPGGFSTCTLSRWNNDALYERFRFVRAVRPDPDYTV